MRRMIPPKHPVATAIFVLALIAILSLTYQRQKDWHQTGTPPIKTTDCKGASQ